MKEVLTSEGNKSMWKKKTTETHQHRNLVVDREGTGGNEGKVESPQRVEGVGH